METVYGKTCGDAGFGIHYFKETESTNDLAHEKRFRHKDLIITDSQTKGRGQRGSYWESKQGRNLTFSLVLEPRWLPAGSQFLLSEIISLAITDTLASYHINASVKWPNDIYVGDKKIAGILIENDIMGAYISRSIIGIGINVNQREFGKHIPNPTSMRLAAGKEFALQEVLKRFCNSFSLRETQFDQGDIENLSGEYFSRLYLANVPHKFSLPDGTVFEGTIRSVANNGELTVETEGGQHKTFLFKEILF